MYSMVLMAAMLPSGDAAGFGKKSHGCNGGCTGTVVVVAGCTGSCTGSCTGHSHSCHGGGGFLGLRNRGGCCGGGGFLGKHHHNSCNGGCSGYIPAGCSGGCGGVVVVPTAPVVPAMPDAMPKK